MSYTVVNKDKLQNSGSTSEFEGYLHGDTEISFILVDMQPGRDPVGETSATPTRTSTGCAFSGKIELLARQMEADAVFHVECPACLAVREIHPKGDSVMFSWHVKRVTTTPHHGRRWVRRGSIWELAD